MFGRASCFFSCPPGTKSPPAGECPKRWLRKAQPRPKDFTDTFADSRGRINLPIEELFSSIGRSHPLSALAEHSDVEFYRVLGATDHRVVSAASRSRRLRRSSSSALALIASRRRWAWAWASSASWRSSASSASVGGVISSRLLWSVCGVWAALIPDRLQHRQPLPPVQFMGWLNRGLGWEPIAVLKFWPVEQGRFNLPVVFYSRLAHNCSACACCASA